MKACILIGTRPEIIKMSPLIRSCEKKDVEFYILHTGQHYSYEMDTKICEDLGIPQPKYNLGVGGRSYRKQVGMMIREIKSVLMKDTPDIVFVQGDTNSVLAGALAANKLQIKVGHHEAGLRSHDLTMLEETNRIITDHISDFLFAPTKDALKNLTDEGLSSSGSPYGARVFYTGNTVVDAVHQNLQIAQKKSSVLDDMKLTKKDYILVTAHRAENVDHPKKLQDIIDGLIMVEQFTKQQIIYPIHPRTMNNLKKFKIHVPDSIKLIDPVGYIDFLVLEANSRLIITDSGGLQEEACIMGIPCVTIRDSTERPETISVGSNMLAGTDPKNILKCVQKMLLSDNSWENPFGDGKAADKIIDSWLGAQK